MIKLSTRGRYATRITVRLALLAEQNRPARTKEIAEHEDISEDYAEQILIRLKAAGLVASHRGAKGGFTLAHPPASIAIADILGVIEGPLCIVPCLQEPCKRSTACAARDLWLEAQEALLAVLRKTTVADLCTKARTQAGDAVDFSI